MALIKILTQPEPDTPSSGYSSIYVDSADKHIKVKDDTGKVDDLTIDLATDLQRNNGLTIFSFNITNAITIPDGASYNLFNSTDGMFSSNGTLSISGDSWNRMSIFENDYIKPDPYTHTLEQYQAIETIIFARIAINSGTGVRPFKMEIRRRTAASPTIPVAIPQRDIEIIAHSRSESLALQRMPTRSAGATDNYNVYGYALYLFNDSGASVTITAGSTMRVEVLDMYLKPASFTSLTSTNI